ncbi:signal peptidase I [Blastococcus sp. VKM Ac-2987]|uniref:signal peptidase I n=1 Tax=Blastococcus sp. VKM Ac-2987 TaxID=3004141 RepID=UPI0022ABBE88|nr:signal peptidase I [Blastococcus sp. VKM Ac-2987]MCZ2857904.1 signal peptidase I [Blastococcus sp. VKM Ac-2987]
MTGRHAAQSAGSRAHSPAWVRLAAGALVLLVLSVIGVLPVQLVRVAAGSMAPTLDDGETVLVLRWPVSVDRWDVVVATPPGPDAEPVVKRVVALGGESVAIEDGALVVDGGTVCEPWNDPAHLDGVWFGPVRVPEGSVFLLGDERDGTIDSRVFGAVGEDRVDGVVVAGAWPLPHPLPTTPC